MRLARSSEGLADALVFAHGGAHVAHDVPQALGQARAHQQLKAVLALVVGEEGLAQALEYRLLPLHIRGKAHDLHRAGLDQRHDVAAGKDAVLAPGEHVVVQHQRDHAAALVSDDVKGVQRLGVDEHALPRLEYEGPGAEAHARRAAHHHAQFDLLAPMPGNGAGGIQGYINEVSPAGKACCAAYGGLSSVRRKRQRRFLLHGFFASLSGY